MYIYIYIVKNKESTSPSSDERVSGCGVCKPSKFLYHIRENDKIGKLEKGGSRMGSDLFISRKKVEKSRKNE